MLHDVDRAPWSIEIDAQVTGHGVASLASEQLRSIRDNLEFYREVECARQASRALPTRSASIAEEETSNREEEKKQEACILLGSGKNIDVSNNRKRGINMVKQSIFMHSIGMVI